MKRNVLRKRDQDISIPPQPSDSQEESWRKQTLSRREIGFIPVCCGGPVFSGSPRFSVSSSGYITLQLCVWKISKRHQAAVRFPQRIRHLIHSIPESLLRLGQDLRSRFLDLVSIVRRGKIMYTYHAGYLLATRAYTHTQTHT